MLLKSRMNSSRISFESRLHSGCHLNVVLMLLQYPCMLVKLRHFQRSPARDAQISFVRPSRELCSFTDRSSNPFPCTALVWNLFVGGVRGRLGHVREGTRENFEVEAWTAWTAWTSKQHTSNQVWRCDRGQDVHLQSSRRPMYITHPHPLRKGCCSS